MITLVSLASASVRENYFLYKNDIPEYIKEILFEEFTKIYPHPYNIDHKYIDLIKFYVISDHVAIFIDEKNKYRRADIHKCCDEFGLQHKSFTENNKRILYIWKEKDWAWEFSPKQFNHFPEETKEYRLKNTYCENCGVYAMIERNLVPIITDLYIHWSGFGPYCEECCWTLTSADGEPLWAYNIESIRHIW